MLMVYVYSEQCGSKEVSKIVMGLRHSEQIGQFISAMMLPKRLAVIKCQAHKKGYDYVIKGNNAADLEA